jgi:hypothetical protein
MLHRFIFFLAISCVALPATAVTFEMREINPAAGIVPAVAVIDIDGDKDLDLVAMSNDDIAWHQNPTWERHVITGKLFGLNVCMAFADLTGDGLPELAAGADWQFGNTKSGGRLYILQRGADVKSQWQSAEILSEPTIHRIRWADTDADGRPELFVAPLMGRNTTEPEYREAGVRLIRLLPPKDLLKDAWTTEVVGESLHIMHNLIPFRAQDGRDHVLVASFEGLSSYALGKEGAWATRLWHPGSPQPWPKSGCSEIKIGAAATTAPALATIEPWHGNQVVVYRRETPGHIEEPGSWRRNVIDETYNQGHALGWADFDGDGVEELAAGHREANTQTGKPGLYLYHFKGDAVERQAIDEGGIATEDFALGDVDGDGRIDIFAGGRATHNLRLYFNRAK